MLRMGVYIHIDMDYFFAQAEELRHPEYKNKIVVVCVYSGRTADSGVVSTVNYEGRKYGIHSGMPIFQAKRRAPPADSVFLPVDHDHYGELSDRIDAVVREYAEISGRTSIDEWFIRADKDAELLAGRIKQAIRDRTGIVCSAGVAPSMLGAKMAAGINKPDGFLALTESAEHKMIDDSEISKVVGIGAKTAKALNEMGVENVKDIRKLDRTVIVERFGKKSGSWLISLSEGRYGELLEYGEGEQSEVSRIGTLKEKTRDAAEMLEKIHEMEIDNKLWLKQNNKFFRTLAVSFVTEDMKNHSRSASFRSPKGWADDFSEEEIRLIRDFLAENPLAVRRIGIKYANLVDVAGQKTLAGEF
jgi:DNA polymerase IV (DinB-like DNA polymerase)